MSRQVGRHVSGRTRTADSSSRPSATPVRSATVATLSSGDSGWIWSGAPARAVSPSVIASVAWRRRDHGRLAVPAGHEQDQVLAFHGRGRVPGLQGQDLTSLSSSSSTSIPPRPAARLAPACRRPAWTIPVATAAPAAPAHVHHGAASSQRFTVSAGTSRTSSRLGTVPEELVGTRTRSAWQVPRLHRRRSCSCTNPGQLSIAGRLPRAPASQQQPPSAARRRNVGACRWPGRGSAQTTADHHDPGPPFHDRTSPAVQSQSQSSLARTSTEPMTRPPAPSQVDHQSDREATTAAADDRAPCRQTLPRSRTDPHHPGAACRLDTPAAINR